MGFFSACRRRVRRWAGRPDSVPAAGAVHLQDPLLTLAWFDTTRRLRAATTTAETLAIVEERATLLDDLEERDPEAFQAWLGLPVA